MDGDWWGGIFSVVGLVFVSSMSAKVLVDWYLMWEGGMREGMGVVGLRN